MKEEIVAADFVLMDKPGAMTVGLVQRIEDGQAYVLWHQGEKLSHRARTLEQRHPVSELRIVGVADRIPDSMILLREDTFGNKAFRVRER
jgi:hypothetical protein